MTDFQTIRAGGQPLTVRKDLRVPMRDGVTLAADAYGGADADAPRPALVALSPYGKELQALALTTPPQRLKASHRELDEERTTEGDPYHPHSRAVPVEPGRIEEYVLRVYPFAATFLPGHRLVVELSNDEPLADEHNALLPPDAFHLPVGRPVTHKIYRDAVHRSRLVLPFTTREAAESGRVRAES
jgi:predicted acyl esterase